VVGAPADIAYGVMAGSATVYTVRYRIAGEPDVALFTVPDAAIGYNAILQRRVEGSIWYTRTRARQNQCTNPSFEINTTGWAAVATAPVRLDPVIPDDPFNPLTPVSGNWIVELTNTGAAGDHRYEWAGGAPGLPVQAGETWSSTGFAQLMSGSGDGAYASVRFYNSGGGLVDEIEGEAIALAVADWRELKVSAEVPAGAVTMAAVVLHNPNPGAVWRVDGGLVEKAEFTGRYFDGDFYDSVWGDGVHGTASAVWQQSISTMEGGKIISVYELNDGKWVRLDFTGSTQYDANAADLTSGYLSPDRIADDSLPPVKIKGTPMRVSDAVAAGNFVNVWDNGGLFFIRPAQADVEGKEAHGFVRSAGAAGAVVTMWSSGYNEFVSGMVPGSVFLSSTVAGRATKAVPQNAGNVVQQLGTAVNDTTIHYNPAPRILLS